MKAWKTQYSRKLRGYCMFNIHVGCENVSHHRFGTHDDPLTPCCAGIQDFEVRHYRSLRVVILPPRNPKGVGVVKCPFFHTHS